MVPSLAMCIAKPIATIVGQRLKGLVWRAFINHVGALIVLLFDL